MAGQPFHRNFTATQIPKVAENPRQKKEREKVLPNPIPDQTPVFSCAENRTGPKQAL